MSSSTSNKRIKTRYETSNVYHCGVCQKSFGSNKQYNNHKYKTNHRDEIEIKHDDILSEDETMAELDDYCKFIFTPKLNSDWRIYINIASVISYDGPINEISNESIKNYKSNSFLDVVSQQNVYETSNLNENTFNYMELMSIELYELVSEYRAPQEFHRKLVRLINTIIRDKKEKPGKNTFLSSPLYTVYISFSLSLSLLF